jgi:heme-degrading monooxygenase HmoA
MYGTVAKLKVKRGSEPLLEAWFDGMIQAISEKGHVSTTIIRSDEDPQLCWLTVIFDSEESYKANAESPSQNDRYIRLRSCLEEDPEWHDGIVWSRAAGTDALYKA